MVAAHFTNGLLRRSGNYNQTTTVNSEPQDADTLVSRVQDQDRGKDRTFQQLEGSVPIWILYSVR